MLCHVFYYFRNFFCFFFFFNATATTEIYTLSLHDALPISASTAPKALVAAYTARSGAPCWPRSEEHTSALQSRENLVCRPLLEKKQISAPARIFADTTTERTTIRSNQDHP